MKIVATWNTDVFGKFLFAEPYLAKRCLNNEQTQTFFPLNPVDELNIRNPKKYTVNFAHTVNYKNSAVP